MKALLLPSILFIVGIGAVFARVSFQNPEQPRFLSVSTQAKQNAWRTSHVPNRVEDMEFKSSWAAEFNDLISSPEAFGDYYNVHVTRFGNTNKYIIKQKVSSFRRDTEKEVLKYKIMELLIFDSGYLRLC